MDHNYSILIQIEKSQIEFKYPNITNYLLQTKALDYSKTAANVQ